MPDSTAPAGIPAPGLRVIGAGFGRTGTLSMRAALVRLGFGPCDHMVENEEHPDRFALWDEALRRKHVGEPIDWRPLLTGFQAIVDWPGAFFWRELIAAHPVAKVVLTVRDPERWLDSVQATIFPFLDMLDEAGVRRCLAMSSGRTPSMIGSAIVPIVSPSLPGTARRCGSPSPRIGYWSLTSRRGGSRSARSWGRPFRRLSRFHTSMTPPRSRPTPGCHRAGRILAVRCQIGCDC